MSEMNNEFEQMLDESFKTIHNGEVLDGKVISVKPEFAVLNIGYKSDGILTADEYSNTPVDLTTVISVGDELTVKVVRVNDGEGQVALSYKRLAAEKANKRLEEAFKNEEVLKAPVVQILKGGLGVDVEGARVFIPASLVSDVFERDLNKYLDTEIEFKLTEYNPRKRRVIGDRKVLLAAEKEEARKALFEKIEVGQSITGTVKSVVDFGAFVDIGGADELLHISEMSWGRIGNPRKHFKAGDEVTAFIKDIKDDKVALSLKFEDTNPWINAEEKFAVDTIVTGTVARMTDFGAFIEIEPGVDALLHVSQISRKHVEKPSDILKVGQEVEAKIVEFNEPEKRISLSMKVLQPELTPEEEAEEKARMEELKAKKKAEKEVAQAETATEEAEEVVEETPVETPEEVAETPVEETQETPIEETEETPVEETEDTPIEETEETPTEDEAEETPAEEEAKPEEDAPAEETEEETSDEASEE